MVHNLNTPEAVAVERVLRAEGAAVAQIEATRQQAHALLEAAREAGLAAVNRSLERVARRQQLHALALEQRLQRLRTQAAAEAGTRHAADETAMATAVAQVAQLLTTGGPDVAR